MPHSKDSLLKGFQSFHFPLYIVMLCTWQPRGCASIEIHPLMLPIPMLTMSARSVAVDSLQRFLSVAPLCCLFAASTSSLSHAGFSTTPTAHLHSGTQTLFIRRRPRIPDDSWGSSSKRDRILKGKEKRVFHQLLSVMRGGGGTETCKHSAKQCTCSRSSVFVKCLIVAAAVVTRTLRASLLIGSLPSL